MKRDKFPEKIPFRLTRMLIKALEVSGIEGTFRLICIKVMELLRNNKDSLLAILGSFIHDPLISFRLMIPMILKKRKREVQKSEININNGKKVKLVYDEKIFNRESTNTINNDNNEINKIMPHSVTFKYGGSLIKLHQLINNNQEINKKKENDKGNENDKEEEKNDKDKEEEKNDKDKEEEKNDKDKEEEKNDNDDIKVDEKIESIEEKIEKKKMEDDERQIFNSFEEKDEIESEELNEIAQIVLERVQDKLSGTDFYPNIVIDVKTQVDKLIIQATSYENLAQSYLGWCPFW
jgi:FKBP12-rapamycin complex-associated protein